MKNLRLFIFLCAISFLSVIGNASSLTLNVTPGHLRDMLLDNTSDPDELILTGTLNSTDLSYINGGSGKISNVRTLDLSQINLDYDEGLYATGSDAWTDHSGVIQSRAFVLSNNPRVEYKNTSDALGRIIGTYYEYSNNLAGLFIYNTTLKKVVLPASMIEVGDFICASSAIEEVLFPSAVTRIPNYAFAQSEIKKINLANISEIGEGAFRYSTIESFDFSKIRKMGERAFFRASQLSGAIELSNLGELPAYCFQSTALQKVTIGKGISHIGDNAFQGITTLTTVSLAEGLEYIGDYAFNSNYITTFNVPSTVVEIGASALPSKWVDSQPSEDNVIYFGQIAYKYLNENRSLTKLEIKDGTKYISSGFASRIARDLKEIYIPSSVEKIGNEAFYDCENVEKVVFADHSRLEKIEAKAFTLCKALTQINLPESLKYILDECFSSCASLEEITLPSSLEFVGDRAFINTDPTIKNFPTSISYIGEQAFYSSTLPGSVTLGKDLFYIGAGAFGSCKGVYNLTVECDSLEFDFKQQIFGGCGIEKLTIKKNVKWLPSQMFKGLTSLSRLEFEDSDDPKASLRIGSGCFIGCTALNFTKFPSQLKEIGEYAFSKCKLPSTLSTENVQRIEEFAFSEAFGIENLEITNTVDYIGQNAFERISSLKSVYYNAKAIEKNSDWFYGYPDKAPIETVIIGKDVEVVPRNSFAELKSLKSVTFETRDASTPMKIGPSAFAGSWGYTEIWLPDGVTEIGEGAFYDTYLTYLHLGKGLKSIGAYAFANTQLGLANGSIDLPETVETIGNQAIPNNIYRLYCHSANPPKFEGTVASNLTFYAPQQYLESYKKAFPNNDVVSYTGSEFYLTGGEVEVGHTYALYPNFYRDEFADLNITWESSNPEVIKVTDSYFYAVIEVLGEGSATLTANYLHHDGEPQTCEVYTKGFSSVSEIDTQEETFTIIDGKINLSGLSSGSMVSLYTLDGRLIYSGYVDASGNFVTIALMKGMYILKTDIKSYKISI